MSSINDILKKDIAFKSDLVPTASGDLDITEGLDNLKEALFRRLVTTPGSLIHRPTYGVDVKSFQNGLNNLSAQRRLALRITEQFREDPRVESVLGVQIKTDDLQSDKIEILVRVQVVGYGESTFGFIPFNGDV